jgi:hypothetical protein
MQTPVAVCSSTYWLVLCQHIMLPASYLFSLSQHFINEKHKGTGASALKGNPEQVAAAVFSAGQCEFLTDLSSEDGSTSKLKFALVGEDGKFFRSYVSCCGTQLTNSLFPKGIGLTRNNIVEKDGSAYEPKEDVTSVQSGNGFVDKSLIPDPKHDSYPLLMMVRFAATTQNPFGKSFEQKELYPVRSEAEIVPVTWE